VENYPLSSAKYFKAVARFVRHLLVEVYVGAVLKMIISPHHAKEAITFTSICDKLESNLWTFETLGATTNKCSAMLFSLVESCFPQELLRAWIGE